MDRHSIQRRRRALAACGVDPGLPMEPVATYSNEAWLGEEVVLRINPRPARRLVREATIAARLAPEVRYPEVLGAGDDGELEWILTRRVRGIDLGHAWSRLSAAQRERAIVDVAAALAALHATPCDDIPDDIRPPHTLPLEPLLATIGGLADRGGERGLLAEADAFVRSRWGAFDDADRGLVHGDPHLENVLWDGEQVAALLDLEWSRPSWIHADLEILLGVAAMPADFASEDRVAEVDPAHYADIPRWLRGARPGWFAHPRLDERLALLRVSRLLGYLEEGMAQGLELPRVWTQLREAIA